MADTSGEPSDATPLDTVAATDCQKTEERYRAAITDWLAGASGIDRLARAQLEDVAARLTFTGDGDDGLGTVTLPRRSRKGGVVTLVASRPPREARDGAAASAAGANAADAAAAADDATTTTSLRVVEKRPDGAEVELVAVDARTGSAGEELSVRTSCDGEALIALRVAVAPLLDDAQDLLDLFLALPWLPANELFPHIRNRLMEDLLIDLCELEGSDSDHEGATDEAPREGRPGEKPMARKRGKTAET